MENIQYRIVLINGYTIDVNIDGVKDLSEAKAEIEESILAGDIKYNGIVVKMEDVVDIQDIDG